MTLRVFVSDTITITDLVGFVIDAFRRFLTLIFAETTEETSEAPEEAEGQHEDNKSPPTLSIHVTDEVKGLDIFGNHR